MLPEASGKDNSQGYTPPSRGPEDNSHLRNVSVLPLKSLTLCVLYEIDSNHRLALFGFITVFHLQLTGAFIEC